MNNTTSGFLQLHHLSFQRQNRYIVHDLHCQLAAAKLHVLLGPNGAGKTTLLRLLAGLLPPSTGNIYLQNSELRSYSRLELARFVSYLPQHFHLDFAFFVRELVAQGRYPHLRRWQTLTAQDHAQIDAALELTDTAHLADRLFHQLSGGERQRVLLARCLCSQSQILLLDEPVTNLDIRHTLDFLQVCEKLVAQGKTLIMSLHDLHQALSYAQSVLVLQAGRLFAQGDARTVLTPETIQTVFQVRTRLAAQRIEFHA